MLDIAVASGNAEIGDPARVKHIADDTIFKARLRIKKLLEGAIDSMKLSADDATVILVGGGGVVLMDDDVAGVNRIIRPQYIYAHFSTDILYPSTQADVINLGSMIARMPLVLPLHVSLGTSTRLKFWKAGTRKKLSRLRAKKRNERPSMPARSLLW